MQRYRQDNQGVGRLIYPDRCGRCKAFKGNGQRCPQDTKARGKLYANDYKCGEFREL